MSMSARVEVRRQGGSVYVLGDVQLHEAIRALPDGVDKWAKVAPGYWIEKDGRLEYAYGRSEARYGFRFAHVGAAETPNPEVRSGDE